MGNEFFDGLSETLTKTAKEIGERAENFYEVQKLRSRLSAEERLIDKTMADMGNIVYRKYSSGEVPEGELGALCENISQHMQVIAGLKEKLASMKGQKICPVCQRSMEQDALYCPYCGAACPASEPEKADRPVADAEEADGVKEEKEPENPEETVGESEVKAWSDEKEEP